MKKLILLFSIFISALPAAYSQINVITDNTWICYALAPTPPGTPPPYPGPSSFTNPPNSPAAVDWTQLSYNDAFWSTPITITPASNPSNHMWTTQTSPQIWAAAFRKHFNLPSVTGYHRIIVLADNFADVYINGHYLGLADWSTPDTFCVPGNFLVTGDNVIAIKGGEYVNAATFVSVLGTFNNPTAYPCSPKFPCNDSCAWTVNGNNIYGGRNLFGTLTNDDVKITTNNTLRGIISSIGRFGFGTTIPGNRVEINALGNGNTSNTGASGLRFSNMNSFSPTQQNPMNKLLSVDASGDVILVDNTGGGSALANNGLTMNGSYVQLGQDCKQGVTGGELLNDRQIPMADHNFVFTDGKLEPYMNRVGIGMSSCVPQAKLEVIRNKEQTNYDPMNIAISGLNYDYSDGEAIGVNGEASFQENRINIGGRFYGISGRQQTYGVIGVAKGDGEESYGGWFYGCGPGKSFGIYAEACNADNKGSGPGWAGYFNGDVFSVTGYFVSDRRLKTNIQPIPNALELLNRIQPKKYDYNTAAYPALHLPATKDNYGVIAQELEEVLPSLVRESPVPAGDNKFQKESIKTVNYTELIPILIQAVKDQQAQIKDQQAKIDELMAAVKHTAEGTGSQSSSLGKIDVILSDNNAIVLDQNIPNPCETFTTIGYNIPASVRTAVINFATLDGKPIKTVSITERGKGVINVYNSDLTAGTYLYTLVVDGKTIDSKKMIIK